MKKEKFNKDIDISEIKTFLADQIEIKLASSYKKLIFNKDQSPHIIIVVGVNGSGKTTTIAKLANNFKKDGAKVLIGAADTFRAAAIEQITSWASRLNIEIVASDIVKDAASIAYDTVKKAKDDKFDVAIIDTAGRLQNRSELMDELAKIIRVIKKQDTEAPHSIILTLDATAGQNAIQQAKVFNEIANITGLIITKLDGTAKAGYIISIAQEIGLPIHYIGIGESVDDLNDFDIKSFSRLIVGLD